MYVLQNEKIRDRHQKNACLLVQYSYNKQVTFVFRILLGVKIEPDRTCLVLSGCMLMSTEWCARVNYFTRALIVSKKLRTDPSRSDQFCSFGVRPVQDPAHTERAIPLEKIRVHVQKSTHTHTHTLIGQHQKTTENTIGLDRSGFIFARAKYEKPKSSYELHTI